MELTHFESGYPENTRFEDIGKIISFIKEGNSCQVVSLAGVGRSNLLGLLTYNRKVRTRHLGLNQKNFHFVLLNFSEIRKKPLLEATKFIFLEILESLRERGLKDDYEKINKFFKEGVEFDDQLVLFNGLKKTIDYFALEKKLTLILLFDRFEEYVPDLTSEFFANLRILRNRAKFHFSVVFSLNRPLEELIEPLLFSDFFEFVAGRIIFLKVMDKPGLDFRISHLEKVTGKKIEKQLIDTSISLSSGHGRLTILTLEALIKLSEVPKDNKQLINHLLSQRPIRSSLFAIWYSLNPSEQEFFIKGDVEPIFLEKIELCYDGKITIPLFKDFIQNEILKNENLSKKESFVLNKVSNEIKMGEKIISDQLTSSEFKLFKILLLNKGKIIEKDEIINSVWGEKTTTLGVTDQALDQLIFRLRKKIEANPNKPENILTVKGRGFKLSR